MIERHDVARVAATVGGVVTVAGSFAPWVASGSVDRSSYDLLALVGRLGFSEDGPFAVAVRWWPAMPLLVTIAVSAVWWRWSRSGAVVGVVAGVYAALVAAGVRAAPSGDLVTILRGATITLVGSLVLVAGSIATWTTARRRTPVDQPAGLG